MSSTAKQYLQLAEPLRIPYTTEVAKLLHGPAPESIAADRIIVIVTPLYETVRIEVEAIDEVHSPFEGYDEYSDTYTQHMTIEVSPEKAIQFLRKVIALDIVIYDDDENVIDLN